VSAAFRFGEINRQVEDLAMRSLELSPLPLAPELASLDGQFRGHPAQLSARAYAGPRHAYARFVDLVGDGLEIANILIVARPELPLPVLGIDLVGLGKDKAVVVADLSPMTDDPVRRQRERTAVERNATTKLPVEQLVEVPAWAKPWFSESAICVRVTPSECVAACQAVAKMADTFMQLSRAEPFPEPVTATTSGASAREPQGLALQHGPELRGNVSQRQQAYFAAHRTDDRGLLLLRRIFEPAVAERFLREVLFPERIPA